MAEPVYKMFMLKPVEAWYQLSSDEQEAILKKLTDKQAEMGIRMVLLCDSSWASETWTGFGVEEYPSLDVLKAYTEFLAGVQWFRYNETFTLLGTNWART